MSGEAKTCIRCRSARRNPDNKRAFPSVPFAFMYCNGCVRIRVIEREADQATCTAIVDELAQAVQS